MQTALDLLAIAIVATVFGLFVTGLLYFLWNVPFVGVLLGGLLAVSWAVVRLDTL